MLIISTQRYEDKFLEVGMNKQVRMTNKKEQTRIQRHLSIPEERWISMVGLPEERAAPKSSD
jgi:hypothetical protein